MNASKYYMSSLSFVFKTHDSFSIFQVYLAQSFRLSKRRKITEICLGDDPEILERSPCGWELLFHWVPLFGIIGKQI